MYIYIVYYILLTRTNYSERDTTRVKSMFIKNALLTMLHSKLIIAEELNVYILYIIYYIL